MSRQNRSELEIGLALSGGGMRAAVFHLGVLGRLAAEGLIESVVFVSTVPGGSLGTGLVYALSGNRWPSSEAYSQSVLPEARRLITTVDIQRAALTALLRRPWRLISPGRWANVLSEVLQRRWGIQGVVKNLPVTPRWIVNATSYETGKNWRFTRHRMGDYEFGYVSDPPVPIADAIAASAGYPLLIGFLSLDTANYSWWRFEEDPTSVTRPITLNIGGCTYGTVECTTTWALRRSSRSARASGKATTSSWSATRPRRSISGSAT